MVWVALTGFLVLPPAAAAVHTLRRWEVPGTGVDSVSMHSPFILFSILNPTRITPASAFAVSRLARVDDPRSAHPAPMPQCNPHPTPGETFKALSRHVRMVRPLLRHGH